MAVLERNNVICPPQKTPFNQDRGEGPFDRQQEVFGKTWWLFFNNIADAIARLFALIFGNAIVFQGKLGRKVLDAVMLSGSDEMSSDTAYFSQADRGSLIVVRGAGVDYTDLGSVIAQVLDNKTVRLIDTAQSDASGVAAWGEDNRELMQAAVDAARFVWVPIGIYLFSGKVSFNSKTHLQGFCRDVELWNTDSAEYFFEYLSPIQDAAYDINSAIQFENLTLYSKYGVSINVYPMPTAPDYQANVLHVAFRNVEFQGYYSTDGTWGEFLRCTDPDDSTDIEPTWDEMIAFGVGINLNQCFGMTLDTYSLIQHFGIAVLLNNTDECVLSGNRITQNGHNVGLRGTIAAGRGNTNKILNNALGANRRVGCIREEQAFGTVVQRNYFETYSDACRFMWSYNSIGLNWCSNRIDNPNYPPFAGHAVTTPICFIDDWNQVLIEQNLMGANGYAVPVMSFGYTYWDGVFNVAQYSVIGNTLHWPTPGKADPSTATTYPMIGGVSTGPLDITRFAADSLPYGFIAGSLVFPFEVNVITGRWATILTPTLAELAVKFPLESQMYRRFAIRFTVMDAGVGTPGSIAGVTVEYIGTGTTVLGSWALNPPDTTFMDIEEIYVEIPPGETTDGIWNVRIDTQTAYWEEILLLPIDDETGFVTRYSRGVGDSSPITGTVATATANVNQPSIPILDIVDVDRPYTDEVGTIRISRLSNTLLKLFLGFSDAIGSAGGGYLQSVDSGTTYLPTAINPNGGPVLIRQAADDASHDIQSTGSWKHSGDLLVSGNVDAATYSASGTPGIDKSTTIVTLVTQNIGSISYTPGGTGVSFVTSVGSSSESSVFTKGLRTT